MWDRYSPLAKINFIVCGSIYSLMKHIFEDHKEPLFGRLTSKFVLKPFKTSVLIRFYVIIILPTLRMICCACTR